MSTPDSRTDAERERAARTHREVTVPNTWAALMQANPDLERSRVDQAIRAPRPVARADQVKVEVRYGSKTVRILVLKGDDVRLLEDIQSDGTRDDLNAAVAKVTECLQGVA